MKIYFFLFQYRMEGFHAGIIVWISLTAKGMQDFFPAQAIFKRLARILASKVTMQISPSFFLYMDVGNICTPFLVDGFCSEIAFQDIHFIIWDTAVIGMVAVLLYYHHPFKVEMNTELFELMQSIEKEGI